MLLVHGFGANADHWRKNTPVLGSWGQAFAIDLLGYGYSDKPPPSKSEPNQIYNFYNWAGAHCRPDDRGQSACESMPGTYCCVFLIKSRRCKTVCEHVR